MGAIAAQYYCFLHDPEQPHGNDMMFKQVGNRVLHEQMSWRFYKLTHANVFLRPSRRKYPYGYLEIRIIILRKLCLIKERLCPENLYASAIILQFMIKSQINFFINVYTSMEY